MNDSIAPEITQHVEPILPAKKVLSAAEIKAKARPAHPPVEVEVPEWDGFVYVRRLSVAELDRYYTAQKDVPPDKARCTVLAFALCDVHGKRLYTDADAKEFSDLDGFAAERIVDAFLTANGIGGRRGN